MIYTKNHTIRNEEGLFDVSLATAIYEQGLWVPYKELPLNPNFTAAQPSLTADGNLLYFSSIRPEGYGGMDIYTRRSDSHFYILYKIGKNEPIVDRYFGY